MTEKDDRKAAKRKRLESIESKSDLTLEDVYELGLEHDQENLAPDPKGEGASNSEQERRYLGVRRRKRNDQAD